MLPTVPDSTLDRADSGRFRVVVSRIGASLMGSGALAALAVSCLLFTTGMNSQTVTVPGSTESVVTPVDDPATWVPDSKRMLWIRDVVDEPVQVRAAGDSLLDGLTPHAGAAQSTAC